MISLLFGRNKKKGAQVISKNEYRDWLAYYKNRFRCFLPRILLCHVEFTTHFIEMPEKLTSVLSKFYEEYVNNTPKRLKLVDAYLLYIVLTGVFQFIYCALVGTFPFNSFLSGFISSVGSFVLAGNSKMKHAYFNWVEI